MSEKAEVVNKEASNETETLKITNNDNNIKNSGKSVPNDTVFTLKRWNLVAMWSWDVECEVCAICRTPLMGTL